MSDIRLEEFSDLDHRLWVNPDGNIRIIRDEEVINRSIRNILTTNKGERVRRPEFGSNLSRHLWNPITEDNLIRIENDVRESLEQNEDRINVKNVNVRGDPDKNLIEINVKYYLRKTRARGSFQARVRPMVDS